MTHADAEYFDAKTQKTTVAAHRLVIFGLMFGSGPFSAAAAVVVVDSTRRFLPTKSC